jgi:hypothetical protein
MNFLNINLTYKFQIPNIVFLLKLKNCSLSFYKKIAKINFVTIQALVSELTPAPSLSREEKFNK